MIKLLFAATAALFTPAFGMHAAAFRATGYLHSTPLASGTQTCLPGAICASARLWHQGCYFTNVDTPTLGGSPLAIDSTQTGPSSATWVYWINTTSQPVVVKGAGDAYYQCSN
jgi:hypothetical protein